MKGRVKWWSEEQGYGFIEYNGLEDIFIHYSAIEMEGYKTLNEGAIVQYELHQTDKGLQARKVLQLASN